LPTPAQYAFRQQMKSTMDKIGRSEENIRLEVEIEQLVQRNYILWRSNPGFEHPFAHHAFLEKHPDLYFSIAVATLPVVLAQGSDPSSNSIRRRLGPKCFARALICDFLTLAGQPIHNTDRRSDEFVWRPTVDVGDGQFILTRMCYGQGEIGLLRIWCTSVDPLLPDKDYVSVLVQTTTAKCIYGSKEVSVLQDYPEAYVCLSSAVRSITIDN
jgi:hypothetical protein